MYDSIYGNTDKVAKILVEGLKGKGVDVIVARANTVKSDELSGVALLCVGGPVHAWNMTKSVKEFMERLKSAKGMAGKKAFALNTKMESRLSGSAVYKIERKLKYAGLTIAKHNESAIVQGSSIRRRRRSGV